jgi:hypothetical protein
MKHAAPSRPQERRQFGRRTVTMHGWILVEGRPRIACTVRNISVEGALLELTAPAWLPYYFRLVIDVSNFETECELRHQSPSSIGVRFVARRTETATQRHDVNEVDPWIGHQRRS